MADARALHLRGMWIAGCGVFVLSFDALLVRLAHAGGWDVAFWRGILMGLSLGLVVALRDGRGIMTRLRPWRATWISATLLGLGSLLFVLSVSHTRVANTVVILSTAPLFAALFTRLFLHEVVLLRTWIAITLAVAGVALVFYGSMGGGGLLGDLFALLAAVSIGGNLTLLRRHHGMPRIALVGLSGLIMALLALPLAEPWALGWQSYRVLAVMGLVQMPLALVLVTMGTRYLPSPEVSLLLLIETVLGPVWVWLAVGEQPPEATLAGGALLVATLVIHAWLNLRELRSRSP